MIAVVFVPTNGFSQFTLDVNQSVRVPDPFEDASIQFEADLLLQMLRPIPNQQTRLEIAQFARCLVARAADEMLGKTPNRDVAERARLFIVRAESRLGPVSFGRNFLLHMELDRAVAHCLKTDRVPSRWVSALHLAAHLLEDMPAGVASAIQFAHNRLDPDNPNRIALQSIAVMHWERQTLVNRFNALTGYAPVLEAARADGTMGRRTTRLALRCMQLFGPLLDITIAGKLPGGE